ncbi:MAG: acetyl-CoA carboxylase, biotin carboxyl carrier protein, partial [Alphaproteobacteria bacterium]
MQVDTDVIRELAALLKDTDLSEIEVEDGERRIRVARTVVAATAATAPAAPPSAPAPAPTPAPANAAPAPAALEDHPGVVKSQMVGTVYTS